MTAEDLAWIRVEDESAAGAVRRAAMRVAQDVGFDDTRAGEAGIVATELATNLVKHAVEGRIVVRRRRRGDVAGVELVALDAGPGLGDLGRSAIDGHSTSGTLGIGLGAVARLSTSFDAHTVQGRGTVMVATLWPDATPTAADDPAAVLTRPMNGEDVCGDAGAARVDGDRLLVLLVDGLGHGPLAARASQTAVEVFATAGVDSAGGMLDVVHREIRHTRGAAAALAEVDRAAGTVRYAGLGNISGWLVADDGGRAGLVSQPGILGTPAAKVRERSYPLPPGARLVLHSDGLSEKWDLDAYPGLLHRSATVVAATLLRDAGNRHDDASVVVT